MTQERAPITDSSAATASTFVEDIERYRFASQYVTDKRVVDLACGTGYGAEMLVHIGHATVVHGFDASDVAIVQAAGTYRSPKLRFALGSAENIPLPDASVDVAVSMETFEHLPKPELLLRELRRVLVPGGILIISTPRNDTETRYRPQNRYHVREYSAREFRNYLEEVFTSVTMWSQLTEYADDAPLKLLSDRSPLRRMTRSFVPQRARRWFRESMGLRGMVPLHSRIIEGEEQQASYQIAVCT
jgi:ubiquinone/menaquinone biosynthesis C-methylase UbiE